MSFIAGVVSLERKPLGDHWRQGFRNALPATTGLTSFAFEAAGAVIVQLDIGAFGVPGHCRDEHRVSVVAGHPFLQDPRNRGAADRGASLLLDARETDLDGLAARSSGNWAGATWDEHTQTLTLMADRLASRPLYWWSNGVEAVFASTLSVVEQLRPIGLAVDPQGLLELVRLGYPLHDRTPYRDVRRLLAGEIVTHGQGVVRRRRYWDWALVPETDRPADLPERTLAELRAAVRRRLQRRDRAITFLSGGMDSRVVNQLLADEGTRIRSFNFSRPGSQDAEFGTAYARVLGTEHMVRPLVPVSFTPWSALMAQAIRESGPFMDVRVTEPAWSGDGGSVCAGWVYVEPGIVRAMRAGDIPSAVAQHMRVHGSPVGRAALRRRFRAWSTMRCESAMQEELDRYAGSVPDPARRFFLFMVENDQRRHLDGHFEAILDHRLEMWTPFLDGSFLETALAAPVDIGIGHLLYDRWFRLLPASMRSVPWQTYPGHVPCPIPSPPQLAYQWDAAFNARAWRPHELRSWARLILGRRFPRAAFRRSVAVANLALHVARVRDNRGWLDLLEAFSLPWNRADHSQLPW